MFSWGLIQLPESGLREAILARNMTALPDPSRA